MSMQEYDQLVKRRSQLTNWWNLRNENDFQQGKYSLRVDLMKPSMIAYCGQQYSGAKNYHDAPDWLGDVVRSAMAKQIKAITQNAVEEELASLTEQINALKERVLAEFSKDECPSVGG